LAFLEFAQHKLDRFFVQLGIEVFPRVGTALKFLLTVDGEFTRWPFECGLKGTGWILSRHVAVSIAWTARLSIY
jgi:hypothetical protein